jgi:hypothetical protein
MERDRIEGTGDLAGKTFRHEGQRVSCPGVVCWRETCPHVGHVKVAAMSKLLHKRFINGVTNARGSDVRGSSRRNKRASRNPDTSARAGAA